MKLGFIGVGNMGSAIIEGISDKSTIAIATLSDGESIAKRLGVKYCATNRECVAYADIIFICVKPQHFPDLMDEIKDIIEDKTVVSIAAKLTIDAIKKMSGSDRIIRVMPNLNVAIKKGTSALCADKSVVDSVFDCVQDIFSNLGDIELLPEELFSAFVGIAGSSPAFIFEFINGLMREALVEGMDYEQALRICGSAVQGSAQYLASSGIDTKELINRVCSPGGTTIEGINALREHDFEDIVADAVRKTINKDKFN